MSVGEQAPAAETKELQDQATTQLDKEVTFGPEPELEQQETDTGDQEGADEATGDESSAKAEQEGAWREDPEVLDFAASVGIPPGELEDYGDRYELERAVRVADRRRFSGLTQDQPPQPQQPPPAQAPPEAAPTGFEALNREVIDEPIANAIEARDKYYQGQLTELSGQFQEAVLGFQQQMFQQTERDFDRVLDSLGYDALFGKRETMVQGSKHFGNRRRAWNAFCFLENAEATKPMIQRAINQEFWTELKKEDRQQSRRKFQKQKGRVLPGRGRTGASTQTREEPSEGGISDQAKADRVRQYHKDYD